MLDKTNILSQLSTLATLVYPENREEGESKKKHKKRLVTAYDAGVLKSIVRTLIREVQEWKL
jgi:carbamoylphosphate synthase small subunit